jgi:hypothetical protein
MKPHKIIASLAVATACLTLIATMPTAQATAAAKGDRSQLTANSKQADQDDSKQRSRDAKTDRRPPGWDHGKKTGWGTGKMPPGFEKR